MRHAGCGPTAPDFLASREPTDSCCSAVAMASVMHVLPGVSRLADTAQVGPKEDGPAWYRSLLGATLEMWWSDMEPPFGEAVARETFEPPPCFQQATCSALGDADHGSFGDASSLEILVRNLNR